MKMMPLRSHRHPLLAGLVAVVSLALACTPPKIERQDPTPAVVARFDPANKVVPTPTDLVRDPAKQRLAIPLDGLEGAQRELFEYLNTQSGWPSSTGGEVLFGDLQDPTQGGAIDPVTITEETVLAFDVTTGEAIPVERTLLGEGQNKLSIKPVAGTWPKGHVVLLAVRGGEKGVKAADERVVEAEAAFHFLRGRTDISEHSEVLPGETVEARFSVGRQLEAVRQSFQPFFELLEAHDVPREEVAVLWGFTVEPQVSQLIYDPTTSVIPLPNNLLLDGAGKVNIPIKDDEEPTRADVLRGLNTLDGFSLSSTMTFETSEPVDPSTLAAAIRVFKVEKGTGTLVPVPHVRFSVGNWADDPEHSGRTVVIEPWSSDPTVLDDKRTPFEGNTTYLVAVSDELRSSTGGRYQPQIFSQLLKMQSPFVLDGKSTLTVLDDASAAIVERSRSELHPLLDQLTADGLPRERVLAAFAFKTQDTFKAMRKLSDLPWEADVPLEITNVTNYALPTPLLMPGLSTPLANARASIGKITTVERLDRTTRKFAEDGSHRFVEIGFGLCIPNNVNATTPVPVVIMAHEITMSKDLVFALCDNFAAQGYATLAIDLPYHGARTQCVRKADNPDAHCAAGSTCSEDGYCRNANGDITPIPNRPSTVETQAWAQNFPQPLDDAQTSAFLDSDLFAIRDHYNQTVIDLATVQRSLLKADWRTAVGYTLDGTDTVLFGFGVVGGLAGGTFAAAEPRVKAAALHATGCGTISLLQDSAEIGPVLESKLEPRGIVRGNRAHFDFEFAGRWALDQADCMNHLPYIGPYAYTDLDTGTEQTAVARKIYMQVFSADTVIPRSAANLAARIGGTTPRLYTTTADQSKGGHGAILDPTNTQRTTIRNDVINFFNARNAQ